MVLHHITLLGRVDKTRVFFYNTFWSWNFSPLWLKYIPMIHIIYYVFNTHKGHHSHPPFITKIATEIWHGPDFQAHHKPFHQTLLSLQDEVLNLCWGIVLLLALTKEVGDAKLLPFEMVAKSQERKGMWGKKAWKWLVSGWISKHLVRLVFQYVHPCGYMLPVITVAMSFVSKLVQGSLLHTKLPCVYTTFIN